MCSYGAYSYFFSLQFFERVFFSILYGRSDSFAQKRYATTLHYACLLLVLLCSDETV